MTICRARITPFALPLRAPVATARETLVERRGWLLALEAADGHLGWGDASPIDGFGMEREPVCGEALAEGARSLLGRDARELDARLDDVEQRIAHAPAARAAIDSALHDLRAREEDRTVASLLAARRGAEPAQSVPVCWLCTELAPDAVARSARRAAAQGFASFKLKLGSEPFERDLARASALRHAVGASACVRVDANGAWSLEQAVRALEALEKLGVELVEQPVDAGDLGAMAALCAAGRVRVAADESVASQSDAERVLSLGAADVVVLKPAVLGGLRAAGRVAALALARGRAVFVTSLLDSTVGVHAAAHLAASLPTGRPADGLATAALFERDLAPGPRIADGRLWLPDGPGLGVEPSPRSVRACRRGPSVEIEA